MSASDAPEEGHDLLHKLVELTGLPRELVQTEIVKILENSGHGADGLTLSDLRLAMAEYLDAIQEKLLESNTPHH